MKYTEKMRSRIRSLAVGLVLMLAMLPVLPGSVMKVHAADEVTYISCTWDEENKKVVTETKSVSEYTTIAADTTTWSAGWYVVASGTVNISTRVTVTGDVHLILADGATLKAEKGITVSKGNSLTIYAQSADKETMGKLVASKVDSCAGIGGGNSTDVRDGGTITIHGGNVEATGGPYGAGIGGGSKGAGGTAEIYGGNVTAKSSQYGAGIGGGSNGAGGMIKIYGGEVTATGGTQGGAGIGGGALISGSDGGAGGTIEIYGGTVTAKGGTVGGNGGGAGIGGGDGGAIGTIKITGGEVTATSGGQGAGIGSGNDGEGGTIEITGGTVTATNGGEQGAGIGGGKFDGAEVKIKITGGEVTAKGGKQGAGIGGSYAAADVTIEITGGEVTAYGGTSGAGIGGSYGEAGGKIEITGGTVTANGGAKGAGIGGGEDGAGGTVKITGGEVTAYGGTSGAGIGGGITGAGGTVEITGGTVKAYGGQNGAGIGGGSGRAGGTVKITSGTVTASGGDYGAGIGGGYAGSGGTVEITGGTVTAYGGQNGAGAAGIGNGGRGGVGATVTIVGGTVDAVGRGNAAKISAVKSMILSGTTLTVSGEYTLAVDNYEVPSDVTLVVNSGATLTIPSDKTLTAGAVQNNGTIVTSAAVTEGDTTTSAGGVLTVNGAITNSDSGTITNNGELTANGAITNNGTINNNSTLTLTANGAITNNSKITNNGELTVNGDITNNGTISNSGSMVFADKYSVATVNALNITGDADATATVTIGTQTFIPNENTAGNWVCSEHTYSCTIDKSGIYDACQVCGLVRNSITLTCESKVYDGAAIAPVITATDGWKEIYSLTYKKRVQGESASAEDLAEAPKDAGQYTLVLTLTSGDDTRSFSNDFVITPVELTITGADIAERTYDGTTEVEYYEIYFNKDAIVSGDTIGIDAEGVNISSPNVGTYDKVTLTDIVISGDAAGNYKLTDAASVTVPVQYNGDAYSIEIRKLFIRIVALEQEVKVNADINQEKWRLGYDWEEISLVEGDKAYVILTGDTSRASDYAVVTPSVERIVNAVGIDVTANYEITYQSGTIKVICSNHESFDENGFCEACGGYQKPNLNNNSTTDDSGDDFYEISNAGQLYWYAEYMNNDIYDNSAILTEDIIIPTTLSNGNKIPDWTPMGTGSSNPFNKGFDGQGYTISGLRVADSSADYVGLFGYTDNGYEIKNIHITDSYFEGKSNVGGLFGYAGSYISGCTVSDTVTVKGNNRVGGMIGNSAYGSLDNCSSAAKVIGVDIVADESTDTTGQIAYYVGGLVGYNCLAISNCYTTADSLVGEMYGYNSSLNNSYYLADTETTNEDGSIGKTAAQFASGEVAYLLQSGVKGEVLEDDGNGNIVYDTAPQIWGQNIDNGSTPQSYPVLSGATVYKVNVYDCPDDTIAVEGYSNAGSDIRTTTHTDSNADEKCDICSEFVDGIGARLAGYTLSLDGNIGVNFYMELDTSVLDDSTAYMQFILPNVAEPVKVMVNSVKDTLKVVDDKTYYVFSCEVAAQEMTDTIKAQMICSDGNGGTKAGTEYTYSVRDYAVSLIGRTGTTEKEIALAKAMLNYGAYAQTYFNYKTDTLANEGYADTTFSVTTSALESYAPTIRGSNAVLTYAGSTLRLESEIKVRHYFKLTDGQTYTGNLTQYAAPEGKTVEGTYYYYESEGISAAALGDMTSPYTGVEGNAITYCPLSYVTTVVATKAESDLSGETSLQNLMKALYLYYQAVVSYNTQA